MARTAAARATLPDWIRPQLTPLVREVPNGDEWLHEIKYDGFRMHARLDRPRQDRCCNTAIARPDWPGFRAGDRHARPSDDGFSVVQQKLRPLLLRPRFVGKAGIECSRRCWPGCGRVTAQLPAPAPRNNSPLKMLWFSTCRRPAANPITARDGIRLARPSMPIPMLDHMSA